MDSYYPSLVLKLASPERVSGMEAVKNNSYMIRGFRALNSAPSIISMGEIPLFLLST